MTLCVSVSLSATVALVCLFGPKLHVAHRAATPDRGSVGPKLHVIAFESHKNVRKLTMNSAADAAGVAQLAAAGAATSGGPYRSRHSSTTNAAAAAGGTAATAQPPGQPALHRGAAVRARSADSQPKFSASTARSGRHLISSFILYKQCCRTQLSARTRVDWTPR